ncbi:MAG: tetratricopeptide repeat protein [Synergistaceae bacterium]|jgi:hypothetical protein|nr:tetratricopeptide repeat protein [Synergistaceae bacterium]
MKKTFAFLLFAMTAVLFAAGAFAATEENFPPVKPADTALYQFLATTMGNFSGMGGMRMLQLDARGVPMTGTPDEAWLLPPDAMKMNRLPLVRPERPQAAGDMTSGREDWTLKIYWGSSKTVKPGQPIIISTKDAGKNSPKLFNHQPSANIWRGAPKNGWGWGVWPNAKLTETVPQGASLIGEHFVYGNYLPHIRFKVGHHDFMDAITAASSGGGNEAAAVKWEELPGAVGYFVYAMSADETKREMTIWTSSEKATAGIQGHEYASKIRDLEKQGVVLQPGTRAVDIPAGIFAGSDNTILMVHGWGEDFYASYPPKPENAPKDWKPDWTARGLFMSTWTGMLGMEMPGGGGGYSGDGGAGRGDRDGGESSPSAEVSVGVPFFGSVRVKDTQKKTEKTETKEPEAAKPAPAPKAEQPRDENPAPAPEPEEPEPVYEAPEENAPDVQPQTATPAADLGFDPNTTTDAKVINSYPLPPKEKNMLGIQQRNAYSLYRKQRYKQALEAFSKLADSYPQINYLSAYWAGVASLKVKDSRADALGWFNRALEINPGYKPAQAEKAKLEKKK